MSFLGLLQRLGLPGRVAKSLDLTTDLSLRETHDQKTRPRQLSQQQETAIPRQSILHKMSNLGQRFQNSLQAERKIHSDCGHNLEACL